jgi:uncharacterized protein
MSPRTNPARAVRDDMVNPWFLHHRPCDSRHNLPPPKVYFRPGPHACPQSLSARSHLTYSGYCGNLTQIATNWTIAENGSLMTKTRIYIPDEKIADFCRRHRIRRLAFFGSVLRDDFHPESDVDVLVEFEPGTRMGMIRLAGLELELGEILGRKVDLNTPGFLSRYYREQVLAEAEVRYDAA